MIRKLVSAPPVSAERREARGLVYALLLAAPVVILAFYFFLPPGVDWYDGTGLAIRTPLHPYQIESFHYPPWFALFLSPLGLLPSRLGQAINAYLNLSVAMLVVFTRRGKPLALALVGTSLPMAALLLNANVEWVPMLAFLLPPAWGLPLLATKPQSGGLAALLWLKQEKNRTRLLLPAVGVGLLSLAIWGWWLPTAIGGRPLTQEANAAPWPWAIPLGLALLVLAWRREDELLAVGATLCLVPYYVIHSATLGFALLAARYPRLAAAVWLALWCGAIAKNWLLLFPAAG